MEPRYRFEPPRYGSVGYIDCSLEGLGRAPRYAVEEVRGIPCIVEKWVKGGPGARANLRKLQEKGFSLLISLVNVPFPLANKPWDWGNLAERFPEERILSWCKRFGLPFFSREILEVTRPYVYAAPVERFMEEVAILHLGFYCLERIYRRDPSSYEAYRVLLENPIFNLDGKAVAEKVEKFTQGPPGIAGDIWEHRHLAVSEVLRAGTSHMLRRINLAWYPSLGFVLESNSLLDIAAYQLLAFSMADHTEIGSHLKTCAECGALFWGHGNAEYCENPCNKRMVWARKNRARKKAGLPRRGQMDHGGRPLINGSTPR